MSATAVTFVVFVVVFGSALFGMFLRSCISERHLTADSKDVVKSAMAVISTLSALVLGLLIATAKSSYDARGSQIRQITANIILLDLALAQFGPEAAKARSLLRRSNEGMVARIWLEGSSDAASNKVLSITPETEAFYQMLFRLSPQGDYQDWLQKRAIQIAMELGQSRTLLHAQATDSIPFPFLTVLVFWLAAIFTSWSFLARTEPIGLAALFVCAISVSGAIFLLLELGQPFSGLMAIPSGPLLNALPPLGT